MQNPLSQSPSARMCVPCVVSSVVLCSAPSAATYLGLRSVCQNGPTLNSAVRGYEGTVGSGTGNSSRAGSARASLPASSYWGLPWIRNTPPSGSPTDETWRCGYWAVLTPLCPGRLSPRGLAIATLDSSDRLSSWTPWRARQRQRCEKLSKETLSGREGGGGGHYACAMLRSLGRASPFRAWRRSSRESSADVSIGRVLWGGIRLFSPAVAAGSSSRAPATLLAAFPGTASTCFRLASLLSRSASPPSPPHGR